MFHAYLLTPDIEFNHQTWLNFLSVRRVCLQQARINNELSLRKLPAAASLLAASTRYFEDMKVPESSVDSTPTVPAPSEPAALPCSSASAVPAKTKTKRAKKSKRGAVSESGPINKFFGSSSTTLPKAAASTVNTSSPSQVATSSSGSTSSGTTTSDASKRKMFEELEKSKRRVLSSSQESLSSSSEESDSSEVSSDSESEGPVTKFME